MPKSTAAKLAYQKERNATETEKNKRVIYNRNRREALREGVVRKGDGKEIDHKKPLDAGGSNDKDNLRVVDRSKNRGWRKDHPDMYGKGKK